MPERTNFINKNISKIDKKGFHNKRNSSYDTIKVFGAREHNLKNINVTFPSNKLVIITGISGSGKSSLAFNTIYAEGQRRYIESFVAYARNFIGQISSPKVDNIEGLSPVIAIEQKTTNRNPRSTVGTTTEVYDFLRLLYSKIGVPYSYISGKKMVKQTEEEVLNIVLKKYDNQNVTILSPLVKGRKGSYKGLFIKLLSKGYLKARVDGKIVNITDDIKLNRYKVHNIEAIIDRVTIVKEDIERVKSSLGLAFVESKGSLIILDSLGNATFFSKHFTDTESGFSYDRPAPNSFSFNSPIGACEKCSGLGEETVVNLKSILNKDISIYDGGIVPLGKYKDTLRFKIIKHILKEEHLNIKTPIKQLPKDIVNTILYGSDERILIENKPDDLTNANFKGIIEYLKKRRSRNSSLSGDEESTNDLENFVYQRPCVVCNRTRLKKESLYFKIDNKNIGEISKMDIHTLYTWINELYGKLNKNEKIIAIEPIKEIAKRLKLILDIGLTYLSLDRPIYTLSGGEAQRVRLATQIGNQLMNILYILDEPSVGLHQRDNDRLIKSLKQLRDKGNSLLVVEHDRDIMLRSDYIIDIGPGAGKFGGQIVGEGSPKEFLDSNCITSQYLNRIKQIPIPKKRRKGSGDYINMKGCAGNNLKKVDLKLPLGKIICVTGVSGSGKSSLIHGTLATAIRNKLYRSSKKPFHYGSIEGIDNIDKLVEIDQSPMGRTPRSNPMTYTGAFTLIRNLFAQMPEAKIRGYNVGRFSFNVKGGRCDVCEGAGIKILEMDFLPSIKITCEECRGKRYNRETLEVRYKGKSIADILEMSVNTAATFFEKHPKIVKIVQTLQDVGLGYITLGQHSTTISGGEAQRIKLSAELAKRDTGKTLYVLDEPSTGLHFQDIEYLLNVLKKLVDKGNTILIIEHNLDIVKYADYIVDMGPEGGDAGGEIIAEGVPEEIIKNKNSFTAQYLKKEMYTQYR